MNRVKQVAKVQPMTRFIVVGGLLALAGPAQASQLPQWSLADPPLAEIGRGDGVVLGDVSAAAATADGGVVLVDRQTQQVLRLSPAGTVVELLGGRGEGPGEFRWLERLFAVGDTVVAYDADLARATVWRPGAEEPETISLPQLEGTPTRLVAVVSSKDWFVVPRSYLEEGQRALQERHSAFFFFDAATQEMSSIGTRHMAYDFVHEIEGGRGSFSVPYLGEAHVAAVGGRGVFVPIGDAVLEVWSPGAADVERRVPLPIDLAPYSRQAIRSARDEALSGASGEQARLLRERFDGVLEELPPLAPPAQRIVAMGDDVWIQPFGADSAVADWIVVRPASGTVLATATVDPNMMLLAGSQDVAVLLGRTDVLEEQFVQLRRIVRAEAR